MTDKIKIVIDRSKWRTGCHGAHRTGSKFSTGLLDSTGCRCCLGFVLGQCGVPDAELLGKGEPDDVEAIYTEDCLDKEIFNRCKPLIETYRYIDGRSFRNSDFTTEAIKINDDTSLTPEEKEEKIKAHFKDSTYELEFIGEFTRLPYDPWEDDE